MFTLSCTLVSIVQLGKTSLAISRRTGFSIPRRLSRSGLPTPTCNIIHLDGYCLEAQTCCHFCKSGDPLFVLPQCNGSRGEWLNKPTDRAISAIKSHKLPFVLKN